MIKASTGLRKAMMDTAPLKDTMDLGFIKIYAGTMPADADAAVPGGATLLNTISVNSTGTGISFDTAAVGATLSKAPGDATDAMTAPLTAASSNAEAAAGNVSIDATQVTSNAGAAPATGEATVDAIQLVPAPSLHRLPRPTRPPSCSLWWQRSTAVPRRQLPIRGTPRPARTMLRRQNLALRLRASMGCSWHRLLTWLRPALLSSRPLSYSSLQKVLQLAQRASR